MKALVVYYSRTGITRKVAEAVADKLGADVEELRDTKDRSGKLGWLSGAKDAALKRLVPIETPVYDPGDYDLLVVGTPVWANTMSAAVRAYLAQHAPKVSRAAFFATAISSGLDKATAQMAELAGCKAVATAGFKDKAVRKGEHEGQVETFVEAIRAAIEGAAT